MKRLVALPIRLQLLLITLIIDHCILMDISMPVMDGHLALATIREQESKTGGYTPSIAVNAHALIGDKEQLLAKGFDGYIAKPVQIELLASELEMISLENDTNNSSNRDSL